MHIPPQLRALPEKIIDALTGPRGEGVMLTDDKPPLAGTAIIVLIAGLFLVFLLWSGFTQLDEVTRGEGKVIPSSKTQIIQAAEAGVVLEIPVQRGQRVAKGEVVMRIDDSANAQSLAEAEATARALQAQIARLRLEQAGGYDAAYSCPQEIAVAAADVCANEEQLFRSRIESFKNREQVFVERVEQRQRELNEAKAGVEKAQQSLALAQREAGLLAPLARSGVVSQTELLQAQRAVNDYQGQVSSGAEMIARIEAGLREANLQLADQRLAFQQDAGKELTDRLAQLSVVEQTLRGTADRVSRKDIRSPVDGEVNEIVFTTIGGFVNRGDRVMDIVPLDDKLLIEARVRPADIGFLQLGMPANVKITAYDFSVYGGLNGTVEHIAADSILDPVSKEPFYTVLVRTEKAYLTSNGIDHKISPGMIASAEILTGKKSVLTYLLKPINRALGEAGNER